MVEREAPSAARQSGIRKRLKDELTAVEDGVVLVGHSLGGSVLLKMLSEEAQGDASHDDP